MKVKYNVYKFILLCFSNIHNKIILSSFIMMYYSFLILLPSLLPLTSLSFPIILDQLHYSSHLHSEVLFQSPLQGVEYCSLNSPLYDNLLSEHRGYRGAFSSIYLTPLNPVFQNHTKAYFWYSVLFSPASLNHPRDTF